MRLQEIAFNHLTPPSFEDYQKKINGMPPLSTNQLTLSPLLPQDARKLNLPIEGDLAFTLFYKKQPSSFMGVSELSNGDIWQIPQVQGAKTRKSYRVNTCFAWQKLFADTIKNCATLPEAEVRYITMPSGITNITEAVSENVDTIYEIVRKRLSMVFSDELGVFIVDCCDLK